MIHVKAYKIDDTEATKIAGGLTAAQVPELSVVKVSPIKKSIEGNVPLTFEMGGLNITAVGLTEAHFTDHNEDDSGDRADSPYVVEVQFGTSWDHADADVVFYGVLDGPSVKYNNLTDETTLTALSWDALLKEHSQIVSRGVYRTITTRPFVSNRPARSTDRYDFAVMDQGGIDSYLKVGSVIIASASIGENTASYRLLVSNVWTNGSERQVAVMRGTDTGLRRGPITSWSFGKHLNAFGGYNTNRREVHIPRESWGAYPSSLIGLTLLIEDSGARAGMLTPYEIRSAEHSSFNSDILDWTGGSRVDTIKLILNDVVKTSIAEGANLYIEEPIRFDSGIEVEIWGDEAYGAGGASVLDYNATDLVQGIASNSAAISSVLDASPTTIGLPMPIKRLFYFDGNPATALSDIQIGSDSLVEFEPMQGASGRVSSGARKVRIIVSERKALSTATNIAIPVDWSGQSVGDKKKYVKVTAPMVNEIDYYDEAIGWYPEYDATVISEGKGSDALEVDGKLFLPTGTGVFTSVGEMRKLNDASLKGIAERYWDYYSKYFRKQTITLDGIYDFYDKPVSGPYETYLGKIVTGTVSPVIKSGMVISQSVDYHNRTTTFEVIVQDGVVSTTNTAPVAILANEGVLTSTTSSANGLFDASRSYDPNGDAITFVWKKNDVVVSGETSPYLYTSVQNDDTITVEVSDAEYTSSATTTVILRLDPRLPGDPLSLPVVYLSYDGASSTEDDQDIKITAQKGGSFLAYEYMISESGVFELDAGNGNAQIFREDNSAAGWDGHINAETLTVARPKEGLLNPDPTKVVHVRIHDITYDVYTPWQTVLVQRNRSASLLSLRAWYSDFTKVTLSWAGDLDTNDVLIDIIQHSGDPGSPDATLASSSGGASGSTEIDYTGQTVNNDKPVTVRVTPRDVTTASGRYSTVDLDPEAMMSILKVYDMAMFHDGRPVGGSTMVAFAVPRAMKILAASPGYAQALTAPTAAVTLTWNGGTITFNSGSGAGSINMPGGDLSLSAGTLVSIGMQGDPDTTFKDIAISLVGKWV